MSKLKIKEHHYDYILEHMRSRVNELGPKLLVGYAAMLRTVADVKDVQKRLRWDLFSTSIPDRGNLCKELYEYMNDSHIDTALRNIMAELGLHTL